jgi:molybdopterin-guanine dinucleotide biosynthesis protein A
MLVERAFRVAAEALPGASRWLVGNQSAYRHLSFHELCDQVPESGPLSGLSSLLSQAQREGCTGAIALACDMPYFQAPLLRRLCDEQPDAAVLVPVVDDRFQPLFGRYSVGVLPQVERALRDRRLALQPLLRELSATCLPLNASEIAELRDWDRPQDIVPP